MGGHADTQVTSMFKTKSRTDSAKRKFQIDGPTDAMGYRDQTVTVY